MKESLFFFSFHTKDIGAAITVFGQQIVSSICTTYAIETYIDQTGHVSAFVSFLRQLWGFVKSAHLKVSFSSNFFFQIGPFYLGDAVDNLGTARACGLFSGLMALGGLMVFVCHLYGSRWHPL